MKPLEFMDALSDVNEAYVRQMLNETDADAPAGAHKTGGAILNTPITLNTGSVSRPENGRKAGTDQPFGGKQRYLALIASAAACIAGVFGIMKLHPGSSEESMTAEPQLTEVQETQTEPPVTQLTEAEALISATTKTETKPKSGTTAPVTAQTVPGTAAAETGAVTAGTQAQTAAQAAAQTMPDETTAAPRSTTTTAKTTRTTTTTTTLPTDENGIPIRPEETETTAAAWEPIVTIPYEQPYLLGDVDTDGDITLLDFLLAAREYYMEEVCRQAGLVLDAEACDRANADRWQRPSDYAVILDHNRIPQHNLFVDYIDAEAIRDVAIIRAFLGGPDVRCEDYISVSETEHSWNYGMAEYEPALAQFFGAPPEGKYTSTVDVYGAQIISDDVPEAFRNFYNSLYTIHEFGAGWNDVEFNVGTWSDEEFAQKMDELRAILAEN